MDSSGFDKPPSTDGYFAATSFPSRTLRYVPVDPGESISASAQQSIEHSSSWPWNVVGPNADPLSHGPLDTSNMKPAGGETSDPLTRRFPSPSRIKVQHQFAGSSDPLRKIVDSEATNVNKERLHPANPFGPPMAFVDPANQGSNVSNCLTAMQRDIYSLCEPAIPISEYSH